MVVYSEGQQIKFTVSLGVSELNDTIADHRAWIERSDSALYQSKEGGRNRYTIA
jgi:diguanylate cyclase (GGDEF)-like protein